MELFFFSDLLNVSQLDVVFGRVVLDSDDELEELLSFDELFSCFAIILIFCQMLPNGLAMSSSGVKTTNFQIMTEDNKQQKLSDSTDTAIAYSTCCVSGAVEKAQISIYNEDCLQALKAMADKQFDLAIVDPPYGIGMDGTIGIGIGREKGFTRKKEYTKKNWDKEVPSQEYFDELFRVSKNQIVWGANYFTKQLPVIKNYIFWHKKGQSVDDKFNDG